jgi:hypothetical protein
VTTEPEPGAQDGTPGPGPDDPEFWEPTIHDPEHPGYDPWASIWEAVQDNLPTEAEMRAWEAEHEAEQVVEAAWAQYDHTTVFFPDPEDPPEPQADL